MFSARYELGLEIRQKSFALKGLISITLHTRIKNVYFEETGILK